MKSINLNLGSPFCDLRVIDCLYRHQQECADQLQITTRRPLATGRELKLVLIARVTYWCQCSGLIGMG